jgi:drug/metabolite transporter (DMT)-like permease
MYVVSKLVLGVVPPLLLVWLRYVVALVVLAAIGLATGQSWRLAWRDAPLIGSIGVIGYALSIWAQFLGTKLSTAQMGAIITSATPAFMVVFARLLLGERVTVRRGVSVASATVGVLLIVGSGGWQGGNAVGGLVLGVAALTWALMSVLVKRVPAQYSQWLVTTYAILLAAVVLTPTAVTQMQDVSWPVLGRPLVIGGVLYLGVVSTALAFFLWNQGLRLLDAASGGLFFFFQPLVGTLLGWWVLGEHVGLWFWLGAVLILGGALLVARE